MNFVTRAVIKKDKGVVLINRLTNANEAFFWPVPLACACWLVPNNSQQPQTFVAAHYTPQYAAVVYSVFVFIILARLFLTTIASDQPI